MNSINLENCYPDDLHIGVLGEVLEAKRKSWDEYFLDLADMVATRATCLRAKHGAIIVDANHRIVSTGYNGSAPKEPHCLDEGCIIEDGHCVRTKGRHSENNAIRNAVVTFPSDTIYVTANPCSLCHEAIRKAGIGRIVYRNSYFDGKFRPIGIHECYPGNGNIEMDI